MQGVILHRWRWPRASPVAAWMGNAMSVTLLHRLLRICIACATGDRPVPDAVANGNLLATLREDAAMGDRPILRTDAKSTAGRQGPHASTGSAHVPDRGFDEAIDTGEDTPTMGPHEDETSRASEGARGRLRLDDIRRYFVPNRGFRAHVPPKDTCGQGGSAPGKGMNTSGQGASTCGPGAPTSDLGEDDPEHLARIETGGGDPVADPRKHQAGPPSDGQDDRQRKGDKDPEHHEGSETGGGDPVATPQRHQAGLPSDEQPFQRLADNMCMREGNTEEDTPTRNTLLTRLLWQ